MTSQENSETAVDTVMTRVLEPAGLDEKHLNKALGTINRGDVDSADLYFQISRHESWTVEDGVLKEHCWTRRW